MGSTLALKIIYINPALHVSACASSQNTILNKINPLELYNKGI